MGPVGGTSSQSFGRRSTFSLGLHPSRAGLHPQSRGRSERHPVLAHRGRGLCRVHSPPALEMREVGVGPPHSFPSLGAPSAPWAALVPSKAGARGLRSLGLSEAGPAVWEEGQSHLLPPRGMVPSCASALEEPGGPSQLH